MKIKTGNLDLLSTFIGETRLNLFSNFYFSFSSPILTYLRPQKGGSRAQFWVGER